VGSVDSVISPLVVVLGVATSAGTHHAGQERAPDALRAAGLLDRLRAGGLDVADRGNIVDEVFVVDEPSSRARNLRAVVGVARTVADNAAAVVAGGGLPLVLGGDCTITLGVVAGVQREDADAGLLYFDGDADLSTPDTTSSGVLDAMGIAHLLGLADTELAHVGPRTPPLDDGRLALLGYDGTDAESFSAATLAARPGLVHFADHQLRADPVGCATRAVDAVCRQATRLIVHFDVDAVDGRDLPLANYPHYGTGVALADAGRVLAVLCAAPQLAAIVLTEVNPSYDPAGRQLARYVDTVATAITDGLTGTTALTRT
jgi:arginase